MSISTLLYFVMIFGWLFGFWKIHMTQAGGLGLMVLAVPVMADALIRPGKGKTWLWTMLAMVVIFIFPVVWFLFPLGLIFYHIIQTLRHQTDSVTALERID
ncbi:MAG: hypothetical protein WD490_04210 [Opitutales bacterium]